MTTARAHDDPQQFVTELVSALPSDIVITDPDVMASYQHDRAMFSPSGMPAAVLLPRTTEQVQQAVRLAAAHGVPIVPQGAQSGLSGAANALEGCLVINLSKMREIRSIDVANRIVVTQPGIFNAELSRAVLEHGLYYPPDPSSWEFCSIGGNINTNAGGLCCVKYGVTTDYVLGLEVVLASGEVLRTGRSTVKGVAGYDLTKLFVGSEGTLGIVTEATLLLRPAAAAPRTLAMTFGSVRDACSYVAAVVREGMTPSLLEIMDTVCIKAANDYLNTEAPEGCAALVLAQSDAGGQVAESEIAQLQRIAAEHNALDVVLADDEAESEMLMAARRCVLTALEVMGATLVDDICVPRTALADLMEGTEQIAERNDVIIGVVGHAGDGNMHPNVVFDANDPDAVRRAQLAYGEVMDLGLRLGGTITGEHGVGILKMAHLVQEIGPVGVAVHHAIKQALDPQGIMNPGKVFDAEVTG